MARVEPRGPIFDKSDDEFMIIKLLQQSYDKLTTMLVFKRSYDDFMILSYDKSYDHKFPVIKCMRCRERKQKDHLSKYTMSPN